MVFPASRKNSVRRRALKFAATLSALAAGTLFAASCRVPPSPEPTADGSTVPISYAVFTWKEDKEFRRISEFFTGEESTGANRVVRSDPSVRSGLYLLLGLGAFEKIPEGSTATLRYFRPDKIGEQLRTFPLPAFTGTPAGELRLGLTGDAWPKALQNERPTAWKLTIYSPTGELLVCRESFLWRLPPTPNAADENP